MSIKKSLLVGFTLALIILIPIFSVIYSKIPQATPIVKGEIISGTIDLNGYVPDTSSIELGVRERGSDNFAIFAKNLPAKDGTMWYWVEGKKNKNYELQAYLKQGDKIVSKSDILLVTAPATNESLRINSKLDVPTSSPLPSEAPSGGEVAKEGRRAMISGSIDLNGHIPDGSTIDVVQRKAGDPNFQEVQTEIPAADGIVWVWKGAQEGTQYEIEAYIKNQGKTLGESQILTVAAPALNEVLVINSIAQPLVSTTGVISGKINLNGQIPQGNVSIVVFERVQGTDKFNVIQDSILPADQAVWSWGNAVAGTTYEMIAVLKQQNAPDIATSPTLMVTAPADDEILTLNTSVSLPPPSGNPAITCGNQTSIGQWNIAMSVSPYNNASEYLLQIGSQSGGTDILNSKVDLSGNIQAGAVINNNTPYYARYAYGFCTNCPYTSFSAFSNTLTFTCPPQGPSPSPYTGYICVSNVCQLTTNPNPPYAYNNQGLAQCQLNCHATPVPVTPTPIASPTLPPTPAPTQVPSPAPSQAPTVPPASSEPLLNVPKR